MRIIVNPLHSTPQQVSGWPYLWHFLHLVHSLWHRLPAPALCRPRWPELCWVCSPEAPTLPAWAHLSDITEQDSFQTRSSWTFQSWVLARVFFHLYSSLAKSAYHYTSLHCWSINAGFCSALQHSYSVFCFTWQLQFDTLLPPQKQHCPGTCKTVLEKSLTLQNLSLHHWQQHADSFLLCPQSFCVSAQPTVMQTRTWHDYNSLLAPLPSSSSSLIPNTLISTTHHPNVTTHRVITLFLFLPQHPIFTYKLIT